MFISVVVPALNEERWIGPCVRSLLAQDYPRQWYEIIVIDNGSTDKTAEIARSLGARVVLEPERGVGRARQRGAVEARGEIIAGTDADAIAPRDWIQRIAQAFQGDPELVAVTGPVLLHDGKDLERWLVKHVANPLVRCNSTLGKCVFPGNNFAVRATDFWKAGGFDTVLFSAEDIDLAVRLGALGSIRYDPNMVMFVSARRTQEGYWSVIRRCWPEYIRVVFLGRPPVGRDFVAIR